MYEFKKENIKQISRYVELHKGDIIYFNTEAMKEYGYYYDLLPGEVVLLNNLKEFRVVKIYKTKKKMVAVLEKRKNNRIPFGGNVGWRLLI